MTVKMDWIRIRLRESMQEDREWYIVSTILGEQ